MFSLKDIIQATGGRLICGKGQATVKSVGIDSRHVKAGELFIAVKGEIFDGHDFITEVIAKGARIIIVHKPIVTKESNVYVVLVKDTTRALGHLAQFHRLRFKIPVIAVTGSAGKTTTKEMIATVLSMKLNVLKNEGTQNNHIGVPLTLLKLKASHQCVVLECGTNQPGDIPWLSEVAQPDVAVFTNIGESHLEKLKTPKGVLKEKWALTSRLGKRGIAVINADDSLLFQANKTRGIRSLTYGTKPSSKFYATKIRVEKGRCLNFQIHEHGRSRSIELNTCGFNNVYNALAAYVCGSLMKVPADQIISALKKFEFPKGRGQIVKLGRGWLINDSYNANPVSMRSAIATLQNLETKGKRIMVAADMLELGPKTKEYHEQVGRNIGQHGIDLLITVGTLARHMATAARRLNKTMKVFSFSDIESAQKQLAQILRNSDSVLVKGSRRMAMERIVEFLLSSPQTASE